MVGNLSCNTWNGVTAEQGHTFKILPHLSWNMPDINVTCAEIQTADGFEFKLPSGLLKQTLNGDCEQSWSLKDGRLLADPSDPHRLLDPATSVSSDRLTMSQCVDELHHEIICDASRFRFETMFRACNCTDSSSGSTQTHQLLWSLALVMMVLLMTIFICFMLRRRKLRDHEAGVQMNIRSDDPHSLQSETRGWSSSSSSSSSQLIFTSNSELNVTDHYFCYSYHTDAYYYHMNINLMSQKH